MCANSNMEMKRLYSERLYNAVRKQMDGITGSIPWIWIDSLKSRRVLCAKSDVKQYQHKCQWHVFCHIFMEMEMIIHSSSQNNSTAKRQRNFIPRHDMFSLPNVYQQMQTTTIIIFLRNELRRQYIRSNQLDAVFSKQYFDCIIATFSHQPWTFSRKYVMSYSFP